MLIRHRSHIKKKYTRENDELVFEADPSTGTPPKIKGHFDSKVVLPLSTLSARDEQSLFSAIYSGSLLLVQDPLGPEAYLGAPAAHVFTGRSSSSVGNALHPPAPFESARRSPTRTSTPLCQLCMHIAGLLK